jgi:hypothetical protein
MAIDEYYLIIKQNILNNKYPKSMLSLKLQEVGFERITKKLNLNPKDCKNLAEAIKKVATRFSCSGLSEVVLPETHPEHGGQHSGRDLKRWAAIQLNELFEECALMENGEFWHEF